jgi:galactan endo-1,6-beta-galactosidase
MPTPTIHRASLRALKVVLYAAAAPCLVPGPVQADSTTAINPQVTWGVWEGWGTSLCWWAQEFGSRNDLANVLFTTNTSTLSANNGVGYNAGACSWNSIGADTMQESPNIYASRQMPGFWLDGSSTNPASSSWDWSVDANQVAMLIKARDRGANHLELFSNSPMWWMCENLNPSGANKGANDNLKPSHYDEHAVYLATIAQYAQENWGVNFDSVDPFNEPGADWWNANGTQEGCHFDRTTQETVISLLRDELDSRNLTSTLIAASDESLYDTARDTWNSFSADTRAKVGRVNVHGYQYEGGRRDLLYQDVNGKPLWNTEYGDNDGSGVRLARNLNYDFRWLRATAWCYWQPLDWADWGLIDANLEDSWIGQPERKYYVLAHYTRHIRPGMTILDGSHDNTVAAYDAVARKLVLVTMNYETAQTISYDLSAFFEASGPVRRWTTETGSSLSYVSSNIAITNKSFSSSIGANTIQTFEIQNVDIHALPQLTISQTGGSSEVTLSWPTLYAEFNLYGATTLGIPTFWQPVTNPPAAIDSTYQVTVPTTGSGWRFFRLSNP